MCDKVRAGEQRRWQLHDRVCTAVWGRQGTRGTAAKSTTACGLIIPILHYLRKVTSVAVGYSHSQQCAGPLRRSLPGRVPRRLTARPSAPLDGGRVCRPRVRRARTALTAWHALPDCYAAPPINRVSPSGHVQRHATDGRRGGVGCHPRGKGVELVSTREQGLPQLAEHGRAPALVVRLVHLHRGRRMHVRHHQHHGLPRPDRDWAERAPHGRPRARHAARGARGARRGARRVRAAQIETFFKRLLARSVGRHTVHKDREGLFLLQEANVINSTP